VSVLESVRLTKQGPVRHTLASRKVSTQLKWRGLVCRGMARQSVTLIEKRLGRPQTVAFGWYEQLTQQAFYRGAGIKTHLAILGGCNPELLLFIRGPLPFRGRVHFLVHSWSDNCSSEFRSATQDAIRAA
jgi:hypothetical protein